MIRLIAELCWGSGATLAINYHVIHNILLSVWSQIPPVFLSLNIQSHSRHIFFQPLHLFVSIFCIILPKTVCLFIPHFTSHHFPPDALISQSDSDSASVFKCLCLLAFPTWDECAWQPSWWDDQCSKSAANIKPQSHLTHGLFLNVCVYVCLCPWHSTIQQSLCSSSVLPSTTCSTSLHDPSIQSYASLHTQGRARPTLRLSCHTVWHITTENGFLSGNGPSAPMYDFLSLFQVLCCLSHSVFGQGKIPCILNVYQLHFTKWTKGKIIKIESSSLKIPLEINHYNFCWKTANVNTMSWALLLSTKAIQQPRNDNWIAQSEACSIPWCLI